MSILSLFPKASGWIRTFLAYYDSRHRLKTDRVQVCVFLDLHGLFRSSPDDTHGVMHLELHHMYVFRSSNPRSHREKCCRKDA